MTSYEPPRAEEAIHLKGPPTAPGTLSSKLPEAPSAGASPPALTAPSPSSMEDPLCFQNSLSRAPGSVFGPHSPSGDVSQPPGFNNCESESCSSCLTLCNPMDCIVHGILQGRILEWVAVPFSRGSSQPTDQTQVSCIADRFFTS